MAPHCNNSSFSSLLGNLPIAGSQQAEDSTSPVIFMHELLTPPGVDMEEPQSLADILQEAVDIAKDTIQVLDNFYGMSSSTMNMNPNDPKDKMSPQ